jgi:glyceraldehyde 3-phosphate dehydrogenase
MPVPFAINGLGRVGRALLRIAAGRDDVAVVAANDVAVVAANDVAAPEALLRRVRRDSVHGPFPGEVALAPGALVVAGRRVALFGEPDPGRLARVVAWYDNEWGYATRLAELVARLGAT